MAADIDLSSTEENKQLFTKFNVLHGLKLCRDENQSGHFEENSSNYTLNMKLDVQGFMFLILLSLGPGFPRSSTCRKKCLGGKKGDLFFCDSAGFSQFNLTKKVSGLIIPGNF